MISKLKFLAETAKADSLNKDFVEVFSKPQQSELVDLTLVCDNCGQEHRLKVQGGYIKLTNN